MFDLIALDSLIALDTYGTVGAAAMESGYTPSAVSQQIKRLEQQLSTRLIEHVGRNVVLTAEGRALVTLGRALRRQLEEIESGIHAPGSTPRGEVRVAAFATALRGFIPSLARVVSEHAPDLRMVAIELDPSVALRDLSAGRIDFAIVHNWIGVGLRIPAHVRTEPLTVDVADILLCHDHPLADKESLTPLDLQRETWSSTPEGTICHDWFLHMYAHEKDTPRVDYWCTEYASQIALVEAGVAIALVPRIGRPPLPESVVAVTVVDPVPTRQLSMAWQSTMTESPTISFLRDNLKHLSATAS